MLKQRFTYTEDVLTNAICEVWLLGVAKALNINVIKKDPLDWLPGYKPRLDPTNQIWYFQCPNHEAEALADGMLDMFMEEATDGNIGFTVTGHGFLPHGGFYLELFY